MNDNYKIKGHVELVLRGPDGEIKQKVSQDNTITNLMDAHVADQMSDQAEAAIGYMAVGAGTGQDAEDTGLATSSARVALDSATQGTGANDNDVIYVATFGVGDAAGVAIKEAGIMRLDDNASLMCYADDFGTINKGVADTLEITWTVTFGAS